MRTLRVIPLRRKGWVPIATVESESDPGTAYEVKRHPADGTYACACMAYVFSKAQPKTCKHLEAFRQDKRETTVALETFAATGQSSRKLHEPVKATARGETFTIVRAISFTDI